MTTPAFFRLLPLRLFVLFLLSLAFLAGNPHDVNAVSRELSRTPVNTYIPKIPDNYKLIYQQEFANESAIGDFRFTDPRAWELGGCKNRRKPDLTHILALQRSSKYKPLHRSPKNIAVLTQYKFGNFILEAELRQTGRDYKHRDLCLFFGMRDPEHFYYVHIATKADDRAHNIFIVNNKPRTKIATTTTKGVDWGKGEWHHVRLERNVKTGSIKVYFDDMTKPIMTATDKRFKSGFIGFGSFDDTGCFDNIQIWSDKREPAKAKKLFAAKPIGPHESIPNITGDKFQPLFDGKTLKGWERVNGKMKYTVEDNCIVGTCVPKQHNGFLRTKKTFRNFIFTAEVKLDIPGNSGIQFRSHQRQGKGKDHGRVYGYQCEIDPSERAWSAGIYDEANRGWLFPLIGDANKKARKAFKLNGWNTFIIKANGRRLQTWINGVQCSDFTDTDPKQFSPEGFIALQVHQGRQGKIRWRNIKIKPLADSELTTRPYPKRRSGRIIDDCAWCWFSNPRATTHKKRVFTGGGGQRWFYLGLCNRTRRYDRPT